MGGFNFINVEYIYLNIYEFFKHFDPIAILNVIIGWVQAITPYAFFVGAILTAIIVYSHIKLKILEKSLEKKFHSVRFKEAAAEPGHDAVLNKKWQEVQAHINSPNPSDWRLAILEADIMLGEILEKMGYQGDSIGDKLKGIEKSDFLTLDDAWEAHRVRNQVAHEGSDFQLNDRDAKRIIGLYQKVFSEFYYI